MEPTSWAYSTKIMNLSVTPFSRKHCQTLITWPWLKIKSELLLCWVFHSELCRMTLKCRGGSKGLQWSESSLGYTVYCRQHGFLPWSLERNHPFALWLLFFMDGSTTWSAPKHLLLLIVWEKKGWNWRSNKELVMICMMFHVVLSDHNEFNVFFVFVFMYRLWKSFWCLERFFHFDYLLFVS